MTETLTRGAAPAPSWTDDFSGILTCVGITDVTHDVKSFTFELPGSASLGFDPGQHLTFAFDIDGKLMERCYTISSAPSQPARPTITVKRVPGGPVSNWLHDRLRVGDTVRAYGPLGRFSTAMHPSHKYLFLSAGSGITPLMSMTRELRDRGDSADVVFVHCARTPDDIIFRHELDEIGRQGRAAVTVLCESDSPTERWGGPRGRLALPTLFAVAPDLLDREIFTCGPPAYMTAVRELLGSVGVDPARCHEESFLLGVPDDSTPGATATRHRVELRRSGRVIECDSTTTILAAASQSGLTLASSCGEGVCGTCKSTLLAGRVDMRHAGGIRQREIDQGKVLVCCSKPLDDVVIDA
ncbi:MAG: FAD-binding oxidoreductase [Nocardioidaceae bacterium]